MNEKVHWGILGVADIAVKKVIPAMQEGKLSQVVAIASRDLKKAQRAADQLGIRKAYGSYEDLLADPEVEAIYNTLPNHLHVPWSIKAAMEGKHVLCEKPISLTAKEARRLMEVRNATGVKIGEAFMVRTHPQWLRAREIVRNGDRRAGGGCDARAGVGGCRCRERSSARRHAPSPGTGAFYRPSSPRRCARAREQRGIEIRADAS